MPGPHVMGGGAGGGEGGSGGGGEGGGGEGGGEGGGGSEGGGAGQAGTTPMRPVRIVSKEQAVAPPATQTLLFPLLYIWDLMNATVPP